MHKLRTVLFDLDGTLIDSVRLILDSYHHTLAAHGLPPRSDEEWLEGVGTPLTAQFSAFQDTAGMLDALIATYREYNLKHHDRMVTVYPGVVDVVSELKRDGLATGLVTSKNRSGALRGLALAQLESLMDVLVCADEVENPKPHPEPVEKAVRLLGADPATTVYVGDSIHDMRSGPGGRGAHRSGAVGAVRAGASGGSAAGLLAGKAGGLAGGHPGGTA